VVDPVLLGFAGPILVVASRLALYLVRRRDNRRRRASRCSMVSTHHNAAAQVTLHTTNLIQQATVSISSTSTTWRADDHPPA